MELSNHDDSFFMNYAIRLASRHIGLTGENPSVGCVLVSNKKIISYGVTGVGGSPHAEFEALSKLKKIPEDTIAYVTLEPCSHIGKNPSCASLLITAGISKVVIATKDPNPIINGEGIKILKSSNDGFKISEEDMRLRGYGDLLGFKQSGIQSFRIADPILNEDLFFLAEQEVKRIELTNENIDDYMPLLKMYDRADILNDLV